MMKITRKDRMQNDTIQEIVVFLEGSVQTNTLVWTFDEDRQDSCYKKDVGPENTVLKTQLDAKREVEKLQR